MLILIWFKIPTLSLFQPILNLYLKHSWNAFKFLNKILMQYASRQSLRVFFYMFFRLWSVHQVSMNDFRIGFDFSRMWERWPVFFVRKCMWFGYFFVFLSPFFQCSLSFGFYADQGHGPTLRIFQSSILLFLVCGRRPKTTRLQPPCKFCSRSTEKQNTQETFSKPSSNAKQWSNEKLNSETNEKFKYLRIKKWKQN